MESHKRRICKKQRRVSSGAKHATLATVDKPRVRSKIMLKRIMATAAAMLMMLTIPAHSGNANLGYDPEADPFEQYQSAIATAQATHKLVLVISGGDWCHWCHLLNQFMTRNRDVHARLEDAFVVMKVYIGAENTNDFFFEQLPPAYGAPHFWIIAPDRNVLSSQSTAPFERGKNGYDKERFLQFVQHWDEVRTARAQGTKDAGLQAAARE